MITYLNRHEHQVGLRPKLRRLFRNLLRNCEDSDRQAEEKGEDWKFHIRSKRRIMQFPATCKASRRQSQAPVVTLTEGTEAAPAPALKNG
jgi:hypothetical protein